MRFYIKILGTEILSIGTGEGPSADDPKDRDLSGGDLGSTAHEVADVGTGLGFTSGLEDRHP